MAASGPFPPSFCVSVSILADVCVNDIHTRVLSLCCMPCVAYRLSNVEHRVFLLRSKVSKKRNPWSDHSEHGLWLFLWSWLKFGLMLHLYRSSEELGKQMSLFHFLFYIVLCPFPEMEVLFLLYFLVPF